MSNVPTWRIQNGFSANLDHQGLNTINASSIVVYPQAWIGPFILTENSFLQNFSVLCHLSYADIYLQNIAANWHKLICWGHSGQGIFGPENRKLFGHQVMMDTWYTAMANMPVTTTLRIGCCGLVPWFQHTFFWMWHLFTGLTIHGYLWVWFFLCVFECVGGCMPACSWKYIWCQL